MSLNVALLAACRGDAEGSAVAQVLDCTTSDEHWVCHWVSRVGCLILAEVSKSMNMRQK